MSESFTIVKKFNDIYDLFQKVQDCGIHYVCAGWYMNDTHSLLLFGSVKIVGVNRKTFPDKCPRKMYLDQLRAWLNLNTAGALWLPHDRKSWKTACTLGLMPGSGNGPS